MPNITMTRKYKKKLLCVALGDLPEEYTSATDATTAAAALETYAPTLKAVETSEVDISFEGDTVTHETDGISWGADKDQYTTDKIKLSFKIAFSSSGEAGVPPAYREMFLMAGFAEVVDTGTSVSYVPVTENLQTGVVGFVMDGAFHISEGAVAEIKCDANAGELGYWNIEISMVGGTIPVAVPAALSEVIEGYESPIAINFSNTPVFQIDGVDYPNSKFSHTTGNEISTYDLINHQSAGITDRMPAVSLTIGAVPLADYNPFELAMKGQTFPMILQHGNKDGQKITLQYYNVSMSVPSYSDIDGALGYDVETKVLRDDTDQTFAIIFS